MIVNPTFGGGGESAEGKQDKLCTLVLDTPILENQAIDAGIKFTLPTPITLVEGDTYFLDAQVVFDVDDIERHQLLGRVSMQTTIDDEGTETSISVVSWNSGTVTLTDNSVIVPSSTDDIGIIVTISKVTNIQYSVDRDIVNLEGTNTIASGYSSHAEGGYTTASGIFSHTEGSDTVASGECSHAEGLYTIASGPRSHAEGYETTASGYASHAEGHRAVASGDRSHAEGYNTIASGPSSHAEGYQTTASEEDSHAEGYWTVASGYDSHAEGSDTVASGNWSHAEGNFTVAASDYQHVQGKNNISDEDGKYAHIVGNGVRPGVLSNAHTLDWNGNAWFAGDVYVGGTGQDDPNAVKLGSGGTGESLTFDATPTSGSSNPVTSNGIKAYVDNQVASIPSSSYAFDSAPTSGSTNPVTSGGVKTYVDNKRPLVVTATLLSTGWDATALTQTVAVSGVSANFVDQAIHWTPNPSIQSACYEAGVRCIAQAAGSLTFQCNKIPTTTLPLYVTIQEVRT